MLTTAKHVRSRFSLRLCLVQGFDFKYLIQFRRLNHGISINPHNSEFLLPIVFLRRQHVLLGGEVVPFDGTKEKGPDYAGCDPGYNLKKNAVWLL